MREGYSYYHFHFVDDQLGYVDVYFNEKFEVVHLWNKNFNNDSRWAKTLEGQKGLNIVYLPQNEQLIFYKNVAKALEKRKEDL